MKDLNKLDDLLFGLSGEHLQSPAKQVPGGDINSVFQLSCKKNEYCIKCNDARFSSEMFEKEKNGLTLLDQKSTFRIPKTLSSGKYQNLSYLLMEWIKNGKPRQNFWVDFGQKLAELHQISDSHFGLDEDNFIGSLRQSNRKHEVWIDFLINERLNPLFIRAYDSRLFTPTDASAMDQLFKSLESIIPTEKPALLHGDLWSGNYLCDTNGIPVLIDPAVYYGHREIDIAMTKLFGGFADQMYESYNEVYPLKDCWQDRIPLNQLYPLLVHVNLFGGHYVDQTKYVISRYI